MASPQKENGYTPIANEIMEALAGIRIPGTARQCLDVIIRKTYGWNKPEDRISLSQFYLLTKMPKTEICRALRKLASMNLIIGKNANSNGTLYRVNKDYTIWKPLAKKPTVGKKANGHWQKSQSALASKRTTIYTTKETITKDRKKPDPERKKIPPNLEMVTRYCLERNNGIQAQKFLDVNDAKGWMIGKAKMVDWQATIRTWEKYPWNKKGTDIEQEIKALMAANPKDVDQAMIEFAAKHDEKTYLAYMHLFNTGF